MTPTPPFQIFSLSPPMQTGQYPKGHQSTSRGPDYGNSSVHEESYASCHTFEQKGDNIHPYKAMRSERASGRCTHPILLKRPRYEAIMRVN